MPGKHELCDLSPKTGIPGQDERAVYPSPSNFFRLLLGLSESSFTYDVKPFFLKESWKRNDALLGDVATSVAGSAYQTAVLRMISKIG